MEKYCAFAHSRIYQPSTFVSVFLSGQTKKGQLKVDLPAGFIIKGQINIFGKQICFDLKLDLPKTFSLQAKIFQPVKIAGGLIVLSKSEKQVEGPMFKIHLGKEAVCIISSYYYFPTYKCFYTFNRSLLLG